MKCISLSFKSAAKAKSMKREGLLWSLFRKCQSCSLISPPEFMSFHCTKAQAVPPRHLCFPNCHLLLSPWLETAQLLVLYKLTAPSWANSTLTNLSLIQQNDNLITVLTVLQEAYGERLTDYNSPGWMDISFLLKRDLTIEVIWNVFAPSENKPLLPLKINLLHLPQVILKKKSRHSAKN